MIIPNQDSCCYNKKLSDNVFLLVLMITIGEQKKAEKENPYKIILTL